MQTCFCAAAEGDGEVHEIRVLRYPLISLARGHGPAEDAVQVGDAQVGGEELVLGADVVIEGNFWERVMGVVGGGGGLAVSEEGGDDYVVLSVGYHSVVC